MNKRSRKYKKLKRIRAKNAWRYHGFDVVNFDMELTTPWNTVKLSWRDGDYPLTQGDITLWSLCSKKIKLLGG